MKIQYILIICFLASCAQTTKEEKGITPSKYNTNSLDISNLKDSLSIQELQFLTKLEAIKKYGTPSFSEQFVLDDAQGEFRNGIYYKYTEKEKRSESIVIEEVTWEKDKNTWITVWYETKQETAIVKDVYVWEKGTEF